MPFSRKIKITDELVKLTKKHEDYYINIEEYIFEMQNKMMPVSHYKQPPSHKTTDFLAESQVQLVEKKPSKHYRSSKTENIRVSLSSTGNFSRFNNKQNHLSAERFSQHVLQDIIQKGQTQRNKTLKTLYPIINRRGSEFKQISLNKKRLPTQSQEIIKANLRSSINVGTRMRNNGHKILQRKLIDSFNHIVKQLKQKTLARRQEQNENSTNKIECFGASLKGERHNVNQDSIIFSDNIYIVCDGHGANGKQISQFVSKTAHRFLQETINQHKLDSHIIRNVLKKTETELDVSGIDIAFSGCTFLAVIIADNNVYCINVGDSKAILCQGISTLQLCTLHKPDNLTQKLRIQQCGGIIHPLEIGKDKYSGPNRIWAPGKNSWGPGLALSRAFGDKAARKYGVISEPQIKHIHLTYEADFIVLGSDGLFDYMKDSEISFFVRKKIKEEVVSREDIAVNLAEEAKRLSGCEADDISCIIILL